MYATHALMVLITLVTERLPAPSLPDRIVSIVPYSATVFRHNFLLWLAGVVPVALWLWRRDRNRFVNLLYLTGVLNLARAITVSFTSLGPVRGPDTTAGFPLEDIIPLWLGIINPISALVDAVPNRHLTKDLFFSGHTAISFLLWLYARPYPRLGKTALAVHLYVLAIVFTSHIHYTIDVIGAWAITYALYVCFEERNLAGFRAVRPKL
jgi:hypothetical protein